MSAVDNDITEGKTETHATFSVRLPLELVKQIDARATVKGVRRNHEVCALVAWAIDQSVHMDNQVLADLQEATSHPHRYTPK